MRTFNLKEVFDESKSYKYNTWSCGFKFEVKYSKNNVARIYLGDRKTKYYAGGFGYCKESSVIAKMINDLIGKQNYNEDVYGNNHGLLSGGTGFNSIAESFKSIDTEKDLYQKPELYKLYNGLDSDIYQIYFPINKEDV